MPRIFKIKLISLGDIERDYSRLAGQIVLRWSPIWPQNATRSELFSLAFLLHFSLPHFLCPLSNRLFLFYRLPTKIWLERRYERSLPKGNTLRSTTKSKRVCVKRIVIGSPHWRDSPSLLYHIASKRQSISCKRSKLCTRALSSIHRWRTLSTKSD